MRAYVLTVDDQGARGRVEDVELGGEGEVTLRVDASSINYKDHLVAEPDSRVRRVTRLVMGVEASGVIAESEDPRLPVGAAAIAYGGPIGVGRDGGFAERLRVPSRYVTLLPAPLTPRGAIAYGLAGYTAMASVLALEHHGLRPGDGDVLVTGATGGVGSLAVALAAERGHRVVASTGSMEHHDWLVSLGAADVVGRDAIADRPDRVLASERWAGAVDCVGGETLHQILRALRYGAAVAASGLVGGAQLVADVYPFITRAVALIGIDSVETPGPARDTVWAALAQVDGGLGSLLVERVLSLDEVPEGLAAIGRGSTRGRWLVEP